MTITISTYEQQAIDFATKHNVKLVIGTPEFKRHFAGDTQSRWVFPCRLSRKGHGFYSFKFGQSIADGNKTPTMYDILACMEKYDVGSFEDFCSEFGYEYNTRRERLSILKTYNAVCKEYEAMSNMFNDEEIEELSEIN